MNVLDSELVEGQLRALGYQFVSEPDAADIVLYNTCSVRQKSEDKVLSRLGLLGIRKQSDPNLVVGVIGCMAERDGGGLLKRMPQVDLLCGPGELDRLPTLLENVYKTGRQQSALAGNKSRRSALTADLHDEHLEALDLSRSFSPEKNKFQAYIRIVRGCNKFCTYCVVPYTRGPEVSRSPVAIYDEARRCMDAGAREITLLGQTVNHYRYDQSRISTPDGPRQRAFSFADLLSYLHDKLSDLPRLRFITSYPADFGDDILDTMQACPRICRYLHIPAQSGSNRILKLMNRGYTVEEYFDLLDRARQRMADIVLAGDMIVGFPTETADDHDLSRGLIARARYKNCFIFKYSPRPGTVALKRHPDDVPEAEKRRRNNDLLQLQDEISQQQNRELIGQTVEVLCEGPSGWDKSAESVIAGSGRGAESSSQVELGQKLAAALARNTSSADTTSNDDETVQLLGRTRGDQIVVFDGPPSLEGQILPVKVRAAHAMTIFGSQAGPPGRGY
jgi:tRNA-2-methylthio-N6-dimethylallyladenosine synthase